MVFKTILIIFAFVLDFSFKLHYHTCMVKRNKNSNTNPKKRTQGMNWIRPVKRLAIYARDGFACCWCGASVEDGVKFTLDHCVPYSKGGSNNGTNLVTSCLRCNSSRGKRSLSGFARSVASYLNHGIQSADIMCHIRRCRARKLDMAEAKSLIERRGGFSQALRAR